MSKIVVINVPAAWIPAMDKLIGNTSINTSRCELVRKAIAKKLKEELRISKANIPPEDPKKLERLEQEKVNKLVKESAEKTRNNSKLQNL